MPVLLEARDLVKHYPKVKAVDGVSFDVAQGICFGLLGPNGAGKSTTIEMLEGLSKPTGGQVLFRGAPLGADYRDHIGIQFQTTALQDFLTVRENLNFFGALYPSHRSMDEIIERCNLGDFLDRDTRKLSGGQRQRALLGIALINDPELLFLDEPTTGLDPQARRNFWELIGDIKRAGKTLLLTTHYMEEAYALCDEIGIMDHGHLIARGTPKALLAQHFDEKVLELPSSLLAGREWSFPVHHSEAGAEIRTRSVNSVLGELLGAGVDLTQLHQRPPSLDDLFLELTGKDERS
ncbi:ABC-2 type transport system ATP-binding protein [Panacagrimonas perspica]|uniref:ABC-2 type transport system ATP-binding protein n=1 Tax=Panacagrimonas perspica TaxID=381431 RepID=A0A4S3JYS0_9GAMM|nr:ABC transporter ATP-binding protein [Panacagrimonas perspica]TDU25710.1 ABC-2 type transport system ATP-binding protein [Panacagrimonas perspica]THD00732.1 ABC transporter ATP-binding protein [Panacagrimonas perspica]